MGHVRFHDGLPFILYIPYVILWALPIYILDSRANRNGGASRPQAARAALGPRPVTQQRAYYRKLAATSACFITIGIAAELLVTIVGNAGAGHPLPTYTLRQVEAAAPGTLPSYMRIAGIIAHSNMVWGDGYAVQSTRHLDLYVPVTMPDWNAIAAVVLPAIPALLFGVLALGIKLHVDHKVRKYGVKADMIIGEI